MGSRAHGRNAMVVGRHRRSKTPGRLRVAGAALQAVVGFVLVAGALATHSRLAAAAGAAFALSTLGCYLLAVWTGLFGFKEIRTRAGIAAGLIEVAAFATLALAALTADPARHAAGPAGSTPRVRARAQSAVSLVVG